jgi:hypothetical protein
MHDLFNNPLKVGDVVAFNPPRYKGICKGVIMAFTAQKVTLSYGRDLKCVTHVYPKDVAKNIVAIVERVF